MVFYFYPTTSSGNDKVHKSKFSYVLNERKISDSIKSEKEQCQTQSAQYVDEGLRKATVPKATFECQTNTSQKDNGKL